MMKRQCKHVRELLPAFLNGTLESADERRVTEHTMACPTCASELASWEAVRGASQILWDRIPVPSTRILERAYETIEDEEAAKRERGSAGSDLKLVWQILVKQLPLVRKSLWVASALTMSLGFVVAMMTSGSILGGHVVAALTPLVAAAGVAFLYGPENDAPLEVTLSTPTSPRVILLARLTLVFGYDLILAVTADASLIAAKGGTKLWPLISLWLGPMLFLSALALTMSLLLTPSIAIACAMSLWTAKLVATSETGAMMGLSRASETVTALWQSNAALTLLAVVLLASTLVYLPQQESLA